MFTDPPRFIEIAGRPLVSNARFRRPVDESIFSGASAIIPMAPKKTFGAPEVIVTLAGTTPVTKAGGPFSDTVTLPRFLLAVVVMAVRVDLNWRAIEVAPWRNRLPS